MKDQERPLDPPDDDLLTTIEEIARREEVDPIDEWRYREDKEKK